jgi:hypothetical protein
VAFYLPLVLVPALVLAWRRRASLILAVVAIYLVAVSGGPEAYSRFRVPVAPLFAVLAAAILAWRRTSSDQATRAA